MRNMLVVVIGGGVSVVAASDNDCNYDMAVVKEKR